MTTGWQVGVDIGGTFTDVIALNTGTGEVRLAKTDTRTDDRVQGLLAAIGAVGLEWREIEDLIHGTTMVTNAIVEDQLDDVALVATEGFADTLDIGRQNRLHLYRLDLPAKVKAQVPPARRFEVSERLDHHGQVKTPLAAAEIDSITAKIRETGAKAVAVVLLHAYANSQHEEELGRKLREVFPYVALSNEVNPEAREYERMATTVLSASVMPLAAGYLDRLERAKPAQSRLHLFHSAGGMASAAALKGLPLSLAMSGPAAGVAAASQVARQLRLDHAISFDMGGTTTDVCLIVGGQAQISSDRKLGERPIRQPMLAVDSIGAGGGSIARLDHGALAVGPESAGAMPGPACYCRGGTQATVTDANLVLGYLDADRVLGSGLKLDLDKARQAVGRIAREMNTSIEAAALGIFRVANSAMVRALRRTTVERGIDGRNCTLIAFGGAGPMHAVDVAQAYGISHIIVPAHSSAFSALGCVSADMSYSQQQTVRMPAEAWNADRLGQIRNGLRCRLSAPLTEAGYAAKDIRIEEVAAVRYTGQSYALEITAPDLADPAKLGAAFFRLHEKLYGFATNEPWQLETVRIRAFVPRAAIALAELSPVTGPAQPTTVKPCVFATGKPMATPRYDRASLPTGVQVAGPAIIEDAYSTIVIPPTAIAEADAVGHLHIQLEKTS